MFLSLETRVGRKVEVFHPSHIGSGYSLHFFCRSRNIVDVDGYTLSARRGDRIVHQVNVDLRDGELLQKVYRILCGSFLAGCRSESGRGGISTVHPGFHHHFLHLDGRQAVACLAYAFYGENAYQAHHHPPKGFLCFFCHI